MKTNLTAEQSDYAVFLPAISSFFSSYIGRQRVEKYIPDDRMPDGIPEMEMLNFLNPVDGLYQYKWGLYSAGHCNLKNFRDPKELMIQDRDPSSTIVTDSGGFQIGKGVWKGKWNDPSDPQAEEHRSRVLEWICQTGDYSMILDVPSWICNNKELAEETGIKTFADAVSATKYNNEYFIKNKTGDVKFLNVLQGGITEDSEVWYQEMKQFCDPSKYKNHFGGWAMGAKNVKDFRVMIIRLLDIIYDGLLESGVQDWIHVLGTSKLESALILTDIQRANRKYHNPTVTISFDCASPFLATANGAIYSNVITDHGKKWSYRMEAAADDKKYATDNRKYSDAILADNIHKIFTDSPISDGLKISDICWYKPGDLNKIQKEGKTSWDSFSYALMMAHNVWQHINAVQEGNMARDNGSIPKMLRHHKDGTTYTDMVEDVFSAKDKVSALKALDRYSVLFYQTYSRRNARSNENQINGNFDGSDNINPITKKEDPIERVIKGLLDANMDITDTISAFVNKEKKASIINTDEFEII